MKGGDKMKKNNIKSKSIELKSMAIIVAIALIVSVAVFAIGNGITGNAINVRRGTTLYGGNYIGWGQGQKIVGDSNGFQFLSTGAEGQKEIARLDKDGNLEINGKLESCDTELNITINNKDVTAISLCGKTYDLELTDANIQNSELSINGEVIPIYGEGQTETLSDSTYIRISRVSYVGEYYVDSVELSIKRSEDVTYQGVLDILRKCDWGSTFIELRNSQSDSCNDVCGEDYCIEGMVYLQYELATGENIEELELVTYPISCADSFIQLYADLSEGGTPVTSMGFEANALCHCCKPN